MSRTKTVPRRKAKKSYTLSPESVAFLDEMRKKRSGGSSSAILEEILQAVRREQKRVSIERAVTDYYSSLPDAKKAEQAQWGEFALSVFPHEEHG